MLFHVVDKLPLTIVRFGSKAAPQGQAASGQDGAYRKRIYDKQQKAAILYELRMLSVSYAALANSRVAVQRRWSASD